MTGQRSEDLRRGRRKRGNGTADRLKIVSPYVLSSRLGRSSSSWESDRTPLSRPAVAGVGALVLSRARFTVILRDRWGLGLSFSREPARL
jgi:hypothetical protein